MLLSFFALTASYTRYNYLSIASEISIPLKRLSDRFTFALWMQSEREKRGWSQSDLSRYSGLHRAIISKIETNVSTPSVETFISLAHAFKLPPETLFRAAGLLPQQTEETELIQQITHITKELPKYEQQDILEFVKLRHRLAEEREKNEKKRTRNKPAIP